jgi:CRP-like cAMP-binding protein
MEDAQIKIIPKSDFLTVLYSSKDVARKFIRLLSNNLEEMETRLLDIAYQSVRQRVAATLINIHENVVTQGENKLISMPRKDIASMIGTATESLNRTLADFKDEGLIEISNEGLHIISKQKLEKMLHR